MLRPDVGMAGRAAHELFGIGGDPTCPCLRAVLVNPEYPVRGPVPARTAVGVRIATGVDRRGARASVSRPGGGRWVGRSAPGSTLRMSSRSGGDGRAGPDCRGWWVRLRQRG